MNILALSPHQKRLAPIFAVHGDDCIVCNDAVNVEFVKEARVDRIIVYGYHHPVNREVAQLYADKITEMHISYLPWNRGADPNFWSFFDATPKGVTLCRLDAGGDRIDVYAQRAVEFSASETLATSYERLHSEVEDLLREAWPALRAGALLPRHHVAAGRAHRAHDKDLFFSMLSRGWNTPVLAVEAMGRRFRGSLPATRVMLGHSGGARR